MNQKITILILTLNEIEGMRKIMPRIKKEWYDQLLVVDGGSNDGTLEYAKEKGYEIFIQKQRGLRYAYMESLEHIKGDIVITFSPDGNSKPEAIPQLVEKMKNGYDMVIASRYLKGAKSYDDDIVTAFGNWAFTKLINILFRAKYTDTFVMLRAWKKSIFSGLNLDKNNSYIFEERLFRTIVGVEPLMSVRVAKKRLKYAEIPADEPARIGGDRKLKIFQWGGAYLFEVIREFVLFWK